MTDTTDKNLVGGLKAIKVKPPLHRKIDIESATTWVPMYALAEEAWAAYEARKRGEPGASVPPPTPVPDIHSEGVTVVDSVLRSTGTNDTVPTILAKILDTAKRIERTVNGLAKPQDRRDQALGKRLRRVKARADIALAKPAPGSRGGRKAPPGKAE